MAPWDDRSATRVGPGALLVAAPGLLDPNFRRTVVYVIEHRERGSLGVVLNRPSEVACTTCCRPGRRCRRGRRRCSSAARWRARRRSAWPPSAPDTTPDGDRRAGRGARPGGAGRPRRRPEAAGTAAARSAGVRRLRRLGRRPAGRGDRRAATGSSCPHCPTTCSPARARTCGPGAAPPGHAAGAAGDVPGRRAAQLSARPAGWAALRRVGQGRHPATRSQPAHVPAHRRRRGLDARPPPGRPPRRRGR